MLKRKTYFIDIDGTIFKHLSDGALAVYQDMVKLDGVDEFFQHIEEEDAMIILTTARRESMREITVQQLEKHGIYYDLLIMGCGHGDRILINDLKPDSNNPTALGISVARNSGLTGIAS